MRHVRASTVYVFLKGAWSLFSASVYTVELVYQAQTVGLNPLQLALAGTVQQGVVFLFQTPTGILADMYSRRGAVVLGLCLQGIGFVVEGAIPTFAGALATSCSTRVGLVVAALVLVPTLLLYARSAVRDKPLAWIAATVTSRGTRP